MWSSLTVRLVVASLAWTAGLLYIAHLISVFLLFGPDSVVRFPRLVPSTLLAFTVMTAGALIVRNALRMFKQLRQRLIDVHEGRERIVNGRYVREVQPVVTTLNDLLAHQDRRVRDALAKAGDLAHGLKTPLAVISQEAQRAAADGHHDLAVTLTQQVDRMRGYLDYHLAHARAAASGATPGAHCSVLESADAIVRTLKRLHAQRHLTFEVAVQDTLVVRVQREDLDEMLGNLIENACKWAHSRICVAAQTEGNGVVIRVDDDGAGLADGMRDAVLQRGVRADEAAPGSGFGLAIVRDLADLYGGDIALCSSPLGGLRAQVTLPAASVAHSGTVQVR